MAHFAELDANNVVLRVVVVNNKILTDEFGTEHEFLGKNFCADLYGGNWVQTSYNHKFRKHYASVGSIYFPEYDGFTNGPKPYPSWVLNTETLKWESPTPHYTDLPSKWDEEQKKWVILVKIGK